MGPNVNLNKSKQQPQPQPHQQSEQESSLKPEPAEEELSTQQLLFDLTEDFEETLKAESRLSGQLPLNTTSFVKALEQVAANGDDLLLFEQVIGAELELEQPFDKLKPMESATDASSCKTANEANKVAEATVAQAEHTKQQQQIKELNVDCIEQKVVADIKQQLQIVAKLDDEQPLPSVRTDSTATASEVEDNIEERLSQLDGNATLVANQVPATATDAASNEDAALAVAATLMGTTPATPPCTSPMRKQQEMSQNNVPPLATAPNAANTTMASINAAATTAVNTQVSAVAMADDLEKDAVNMLEEDPDLDEMIKALKNFENNSNTDNITANELNVFFREVYSSFNCGEEGAQQAGIITQPARTSPIKEMQTELKKLQLTMQRKTDFLLRRVRKLQARYMCKHASEEIANIVEYATSASRNALAKSVNQTNKTLPPQPQESKAVAQQPQQTAVSSRQVVQLLQKVEKTATEQQICTKTAQSTKRKYRKAGTTDDASESTDTADKKLVIVPLFDEKVTPDIEYSSGLLKSALREVQLDIDSDATLSSSGGESMDEMISYNNSSQLPLPIEQRAVSKYLCARAAIAARWNWLHSQISDLEIKILKHQELRAELRRSKAADFEGYKSSANTSAGKQESFNGFKGNNNMQSSFLSTSLKDEILEETEGSARTHLTLSANFRKRKLFQTPQIHTFSKRAARPSNIKCGCQWPVHPCALCTGRTDPTAPRDLRETLTVGERAALLDPGFHPVLSFPEEIPIHLHMDAVTAQYDFQMRAPRLAARQIVKTSWKAERDLNNAASNAYSSNFGAPVLQKKYSSEQSSFTKRKYQRKQREQQPKERPHVNNGNGTGTLSMSSTPLVANRLANAKSLSKMTSGSSSTLSDQPNAMKTFYGMQPSCSNYNNSQQQQQQRAMLLQNNNSDLGKTAPYNHSLAHSSSISNNVKNNRGRKSAATCTITTNSYQQHQHLSQQQLTHGNNNYNNQLNDNNQHTSNNNCDFNHQQFTSDSWDGLNSKSGANSPTHAAGSNNNYYRYERRARDQYDIDNIVIPYSMAAATPIEVLPYKEIPTPKWRIMDEEEAQDDDKETVKALMKQEDPIKRENNGADLPKELVPKENGRKIDNNAALATFFKVEASANEEAADIKAAVLKNNVTKEFLLPAVTHAELKGEAAANELHKETAANEVKKNNAEAKFAGSADVALKQELDTKFVSVSELNTEKQNIPKKEVDVKQVQPSPPNKAKAAVVEHEGQQQLAAVCDESVIKEMVEINKQQLISSAGINDMANAAKANVTPSGSAEQVELQIQTATATAAAATVTKRSSRENGVADTWNCQAIEPPAKKLCANNNKVQENSGKGKVLAFQELDEKVKAELQEITDEAIVVRHERNALEERRKFQTFLKFPWSTRSRANRRTESRAGSSGGNTPDPASPAPHTPGGAGGDLESIPSPLSALESALECAAGAAADVGGSKSRSSKSINERKRTTSLKKEKELLEMLNATDSRELIGFEERVFPLPDDVYAEMVQMMPSDHFEDTDNDASSKWCTDGGSFEGGNNTKDSTNSKRRTASIKCDSLGNMDVDEDDAHNDPDYDFDEDDEDDEGDEGEEGEEDDLDDDSVKDILMPNDREEEKFQREMAERNALREQQEQAAMNGADSDYSEADPFSDDDPDDPDWKGERRRERDKTRRRL